VRFCIFCERHRAPPPIPPLVFPPSRQKGRALSTRVPREDSRRCAQHPLTRTSAVPGTGCEFARTCFANTFLPPKRIFLPPHQVWPPSLELLILRDSFRGRVLPIFSNSRATRARYVNTLWARDERMARTISLHTKCIGCSL